jgi:hypothetical protein
METLTDMDASDIAPIPTQQPPCFQMKNSFNWEVGVQHYSPILKIETHRRTKKNFTTVHTGAMKDINHSY